MQCVGWSFTAGGLLSKAMLLLTQLHVPVGNRLEKDAEAAVVGFVDSEIPSDQILFPTIQEYRSRPGFCESLTKPFYTQVQGVGGLLSSFLESGEFSCHSHKPAWFFLPDNFLSLPQSSVHCFHCCFPRLVVKQCKSRDLH